MLASRLCCLLLLLAFDFIAADSQQWIDPFDMTGKRPAEPTSDQPPSHEPKVKAKHAKPLYSASKPQPENPSCPKEGLDYRFFYRQLVRSLWLKVAAERAKGHGQLLLAHLEVSDRTQHVLERFVRDNPEDAAAEVNEAMDSLFKHIRTVDPVANARPWLGLDSEQWWRVVTYAILVLVIFILALPMLLIARSHWSGVARCILTTLYISWLWTWIVLYKREVASRRTAFLKSQGNSDCNEAWYESLGHYFAAVFVVTPDRCAALQEKLVVDPWLEVTPMRALVHMVVQVLLEPAMPLAEHSVKFMRTLFGGLPVLHAFGAGLVLCLLLVLLLTYLFGYRIRMPFLLAVEPALPASLSRLDEERLSERICASIERRDSAVLEPFLAALTARRNSDRAAMILAGRRKKAFVDGRGDGPLEEDSEVASSDSEPEAFPEAVL